MGKIYIGEPPTKTKKAAAYARVSLETDKLAHSLSAQTDYFRGIIRSRSDWELVGVYSDSFISGTEATNRAGFQRLLADCGSGKIDVVLCKSISRFARNTVDLLKTVRYLKELGIEVRFEKENINSLSGDGELLLTILASFAQEESRSISENVKWGIRKRFREFTAQPRNKIVFGYRFDGGHYIIKEDEAQTVRRIFRSYIAGASLRSISAELKELGAKSTLGFDFSHGMIDYIVHNEIYIGNIVLQKTFVKDFITHQKVPNRGELPTYRLCGCHEPIIDAETFAAAQRETERRAAGKRVYPFSRRIFCGKCGKPFTRRSNNGKYACWHCRECETAKLKEDKLKAMFDLCGEEITESVSRIIVHENGKLDISFYDGRNEEWQYE